MATVLVVDDRSINLSYLGALLRLGEHQVLEAGDGHEALARVRDALPDLIITDLKMPGMDGIEFARQVRADPLSHHIPIVVYTAADRVGEARSLARSWGVSAVLGKPSDKDTILRTVHELLGLPATAPVAAGRPVVYELREGAPKEAGADGLAQRLSELLELGLTLATCRDPLYLLDISCRAAQHLLGARYAAIGVLDEHGDRLAHFLVHGLKDTESALTANWNPRGGLLGEVLIDRRPRRAHGPVAASTLGLPPQHPPVSSFLAVPVVLQGRPYGWLYLADKSGAPAFDADDERIAVSLAAQLGSAQESLLLHDKLERRGAALEREVAQRQQAEAEVRRLNADLERRVAERTAELQASRQHLRTIADNVPALIAYIDTAERYAFTNTPYERFVGAAPGEILGRTVQAVLGPQRYAQVRERIAQALAGVPATFEAGLERDGAMRYLLASYLPDRAEDGTIRGVYVHAQDITERKQAAQARQAELEAMNDASPLGMFRADPRGRCTYLNRTCESIVGLGRGQALGLGWIRAIHPGDRARVQKAWRDAVRGRVAHSDTYRLQHADGQVVWVTVKAAPIVVNAQPSGYVGTVEDITVRRDTEDTRDRLAAILEVSTDLVATTDFSGRLRYINPAGRRLRGLAPDADIGATTVADYFPAWALQRIVEEAKPAVMQGGVWMGETAVLDAQGREVPVQHMMLAQRTADGRVALFASVMRDISGAKAAERALRNSEERLRLITDHMPALISYLDREQRFRFANKTYQEWFGVAPAQLIGMSLREFYGDAITARIRPHVETALAGHVVTYEREMQGAGEHRYVHVHLVPHRDDTDKVVGLYTLIQDITPRRLAEQALQESERRYRSLYESTPAILHSIDAQGRLMTVSDLWLRVMGYERAEVIGRRSSEFLTPDSARHARETVLPEFFRTGRCDRVEYQFVRSNGGVIDVLLSAILERNEAGEPLRSFAVLEDITERKRLAAELGRTHAHLDAIVDNVPALLGHWDTNGTTRFVNREYQAAVGLPMEQIIDRPLREIHDNVDPVSYKALAPRIAEVLQGRRQEFDLPMLTTSGLRQLRMTLVPDQPQDGRVTGYYGMAHDITGRKALELRLTDSERRYRSLFDNLNSGFALHEIVVDADGKPGDYKFLAMNAAFAAMNGLEPQSTIGRRATELRAGMELTDSMEIYGHVALSGQPVHFEQHAAKTDRWFEIVAYRPALGQVAVIAQDVSQRKEAEARLQEALMEKETLLKEVYHRVKNNLQVVQSLLSLQQRSMPDGPARSALDDSVQRVRAMALVHEKLYQAGNLAAVSLPDYTQDLLRQIGEAMGVSQRRIVLQAEIAALQTGLDNAVPFGLLVAELVGNALKHGFREHKGGLVRVVLVARASGAHLSVSDDGFGLPADFDLSAASSMGLQLASILAGQLGGELQATTDRGATFSALLTRL